MKYGDVDDECGSKGLCVVRFMDYAEQEVKNNGKEIIWKMNIQLGIIIL